MQDLQLPPIDYGAIAPMLILFGVACLGVFFEAVLPKAARRSTQLVLALLGLVAAFVVVVIESDTRILTAGGAVAIDGPTLFLQGAIILLGLMALLLVGDRSLEEGGAFVAQAAITVGSDADRRQATRSQGATEIYPLAIFALAGMLLFVAANDLLTMFVALEVFSLPLYLLCALARRRRLLSQEAALKYFLLGAYASAFFLFGVALVYGFAGGVQFGTIHNAVRESTQSTVLLYGGIALIAIGLLFKAAAAPFHVWTPDVYQGAPTPITGLMAACTKVAAFAVVTLVRDADGEATHLSRWAGLGRRSPLFAGIFTFILLAFAGIPLTSGFVAKFAVFGAAMDSGDTWLVIFGVITSMLLAFPYLRVVVMMWLSEPGETTPTVSIPGGLTAAALMIGVVATLVLGVAPAPLLDLTSNAAEFVR